MPNNLQRCHTVSPSKIKIPSKKSRQQCCTEGFNSGVKGLKKLLHVMKSDPHVSWQTKIRNEEFHTSMWYNRLTSSKYVFGSGEGHHFHIWFHSTHSCHELHRVRTPMISQPYCLWFILIYCTTPMVFTTVKSVKMFITIFHMFQFFYQCNFLITYKAVNHNLVLHFLWHIHASLLIWYYSVTMNATFYPPNIFMD
jgi:hypothetical protein